MPRRSEFRRRSTGWTLALLLLSCCAWPLVARSDDPATPRSDDESLSVLFAELDSPRFDFRERAARRLDDLAARPETAGPLARRIHAQLLLPSTSFELRTRLERYLKLLPATDVPPVEATDEQEVARLIAALDAESFAQRRGAAHRLEWLMGNSDLVAPVMLALKTRLADASRETDRPTLERLLKAARGAWLLSDPAGWSLPPVPSEQITAWIDELLRPVPEGNPGETWTVHAAAERELVDLLARDDHRPLVERALNERLAVEGLDDAARGRLTAVLDWIRPAMVAEYWQGGRHMGVQYLYVDVPTTPDQGLRPSHFDRIDDRTAHCVSGNSLSAGDYPVGVAFPHPRNGDAQFRLVNLPTPLRRLRYEHVVDTDERARWLELCQQTLDRLDAERRPLSEPELSMLFWLDAASVSRFAGKHLAAVDDGDYSPEGRYYGDVGDISRHGVMMLVLAHHGTHHAIDGLTTAIERKRVRAANEDAPYDLAWMAALAIVARDPWVGVDDWLAERLPHDASLILDREAGPQLGATAAGLLLRRHGLEPGQYGLLEAPDDVFDEVGLAGYRFESRDQSKRILDAIRGRAAAAP